MNIFFSPPRCGFERNELKKESNRDEKFINVNLVFIQVAEAEKKKAEAHTEHQRKAHIFNKIDLEVCFTHTHTNTDFLKS